MEELLKYLKNQLIEAEKSMKDAEECLRLSELMGIDIAEAKLRFEQSKQKYLKLKSGFEKYLAEKGIKI